MEEAESDSPSNPSDLLDEVCDMASFLRFVEALIRDRVEAAAHPTDAFGRGVRGWENHTIEGFLGAAATWAEITEMGANEGLDVESPWKRFATFLYCGKIYE